MSWVCNGITGRGDLPACAGSYSGTAIVLGTARCAWEDVEAARSQLSYLSFDLIAINGMAFFYPGPKLRHAVSMHPKELEYWRSLRKIYEGQDGETFLTHSYKPRADVTWNIRSGNGGTSALLAVMVGLALGYGKIILCGVPMDGSGHFYDPPGIGSVQFTQDWLETEWKKTADVFFKGRVRSMSGRTRDWLGEPTREWINGSAQ